ncbi:MAG: hypothetical protein ACOC3X_03630 [Nanoarchaeota archaeon]
MAINFFNSVDFLEPKCKNCGFKIDYGVTTRWDDKINGHICIKCNKPLETEEKNIQIDNETYVD